MESEECAKMAGFSQLYKYIQLWYMKCMAYGYCISLSRDTLNSYVLLVILISVCVESFR